MSDIDARLLAPGFMFSQHSLNTYQRCPRRFLLRYIERQPWPVPEDEQMAEHQAQLARGRTLHQWLARQQLGIDMSAIVAACRDEELVGWWHAAQRFDWDMLPDGYRQAEMPIMVPLSAYRLYARYDLLACGAGQAVVVDWKTLQTRPRERILRERLQTQVYLYTLAAASDVIAPGQSISPDEMRMIYWFSNFPDEPAIIRYSRERFQRDGQLLCELAEQIATQPREAFEMTSDLRICRNCVYRTLCRRETEGLANDETWLEEEIDFEIDWSDSPDAD